LRDPGRAGRPHGRRLSQTLRDAGRRHGVAAGQERRELLPADPRQQIRRAQLGRPCRRDRFEDAVAVLMTVVVVDALEVIDVKDHHAQRFATAARRRNRPLKRIVPRAAVGHAGQRIGAGERFEFADQPRALGEQGALPGDQGVHREADDGTDDDEQCAAAPHGRGIGGSPDENEGDVVGCRGGHEHGDQLCARPVQRQPEDRQQHQR
jgi:hypothetical protein